MELTKSRVKKELEKLGYDTGEYVLQIYTSTSFTFWPSKETFSIEEFQQLIQVVSSHFQAVVYLNITTGFTVDEIGQHPVVKEPSQKYTKPCTFKRIDRLA